VGIGRGGGRGEAQRTNRPGPLPRPPPAALGAPAVARYRLGLASELHLGAARQGTTATKPPLICPLLHCQPAGCMLPPPLVGCSTCQEPTILDVSPSRRHRPAGTRQMRAAVLPSRVVRQPGGGS